jgi:hypothetical protein
MSSNSSLRTDPTYLVLATSMAVLAVTPVLLKVILDSGAEAGAEVEYKPMTTLATSSTLVVTSAILPMLPPLLSLLPYLSLNLTSLESSYYQVNLVSETSPF